MASPNPKRPGIPGHARRAAALALLASCLAVSLAGAAAGDEPPLSAKPLLARPFPRGKTMFVRLSPEETGVRVENPYDDARMWGDLYPELADGAIYRGSPELLTLRLERLAAITLELEGGYVRWSELESLAGSA